VALDPDSRLVLSVVVGKRVGETAVALLEDAKRRLGGRTPELVTSDEWSAYPEAIRRVFGDGGTPEGLNYATVHKTRAKELWAMARTARWSRVCWAARR
jgi:hypothetical protein